MCVYFSVPSPHPQAAAASYGHGTPAPDRDAVRVTHTGPNRKDRTENFSPTAQHAPPQQPRAGTGARHIHLSISPLVRSRLGGSRPASASTRAHTTQPVTVSPTRRGRGRASRKRPPWNATQTPASAAISSLTQTRRARPRRGLVLFRSSSSPPPPCAPRLSVLDATEACQWWATASPRRRTRATMPVKRSASAVALPPVGRRARARLCIRLAAPLSFLLLFVALFHAQPLLGVPPAAQPPSAGPGKVAFLFLVRAGVPLDFLWDAFFRVSIKLPQSPWSIRSSTPRLWLSIRLCFLQNGEEGKFSVYVHSAPGFQLDRTTTGSPYFYGRQLAMSVKVRTICIFLLYLSCDVWPLSTILTWGIWLRAATCRWCGVRPPWWRQRGCCLPPRFRIPRTSALFCSLIGRCATFWCSRHVLIDLVCTYSSNSVKWSTLKCTVHCLNLDGFNSKL